MDGCARLSRGRTKQPRRRPRRHPGDVNLRSDYGQCTFLRSAFDYLSSNTCRCAVTSPMRRKSSRLYDATARTAPFLTTRGGRMDDEGWGRFEWHVLRRMLYGVDIDLPLSASPARLLPSRPQSI